MILSWTPGEYRSFIHGAQLREIDEYEQLAKGAMFHRYALNAKRASEKKLFDAEKARRRLEQGSKKWKDSRDPRVKQEKYEKIRKALDGYTPVFHQKGGLRSE